MLGASTKIRPTILVSLCLLFGTHGWAEGRYFEHRGAKLYFETAGNAARPAVLVLHGGLARIESMKSQISALSQHYFVIAPDSRGHGRSSSGSVPLSYAVMADDMLALLDFLGVPRASVVGWSDGGIIGLHLAIHHPDRLETLVVMGANYDTSGIDTTHHLSPDDPAFAPAHEAYTLLSPTPDRWLDFFDEVTTLWREQPEYSIAQLSTIRSPTLVIAGEFDSVNRDHTVAMADAIPDARLLIVEGASHFLHREKPALINEVILEFLARSDSGRRHHE